MKKTNFIKQPQHGTDGAEIPTPASLNEEDEDDK
jgi:hypothetical protein